MADEHPARRKEAAVWMVAHTLIASAGRLALLRRAGTGRADGLWAPPGGRVEPGESPRDAAIREVHEELGLVLCAEAVHPLATLYFDDLHSGRGVNAIFCHVLEGATPALPVLAGVSDRSAWCDPDALPTPAVPWLHRCIGRWQRQDGGASSGWYGDSEVE